MGLSDPLMHDVVTAALRFGSFTLRSGTVSDHYFDKYQLFARPGLLFRLVPRIVSLVPSSADMLAGLELGGVPLATALSLSLAKPVAFVRKQAKTYGTCLLAEGAEVGGRKVCVVEDVVTTGGQVLESVKALRDLGALVDGVICVINRGGQDSYTRFRDNGICLRSLYDYEQLAPLVAAARNVQRCDDGV